VSSASVCAYYAVAYTLIALNVRKEKGLLKMMSTQYVLVPQDTIMMSLEDVVNAFHFANLALEVVLHV
jgi:hypothetical protein